MINSFKNYYRNQSPKLLISLLFFLAALVVFWLITDEVIIEKDEAIDLLVFHYFETHIIRPGLTEFMYMITNFASAPFMMIASSFLIVLLLIFKYYRKAAFALVTALGGQLLIYGMKMFFARPRPPYPLLYKEENFSFPSGHATFSFIFYGMLAYFTWLTDLPKGWKYITTVFLLMLSLTIGFSRIYLRVHYASDVVGGFCLGYSWLFLMIYIFRKWYPHH